MSIYSKKKNLKQILKKLMLMEQQAINNKLNNPNLDFFLLKIHLNNQ